MLLNRLARGCKARTLLEIGTSYGYSTLWLAEAYRARVRATGKYDSVLLSLGSGVEVSRRLP